MAFAVHIKTKHCTSCNNCVVACPVDAYGIHRGDLVSAELVSPYEASGIPDGFMNFVPGAAFVSRRAHTVLSDVQARGIYSLVHLCNKKQREG